VFPLGGRPLGSPRPVLWCVPLAAGCCERSGGAGRKGRSPYPGAALSRGTHWGGRGLSPRPQRLRSQETEIPDEVDEALEPEPDVEAIGRDVHPLDQQLNDSGLLCRDSSSHGDSKDCKASRTAASLTLASVARTTRRVASTTNAEPAPPLMFPSGPSASP
jgi:hypothetical protein